MDICCELEVHMPGRRPACTAKSQVASSTMGLSAGQWHEQIIAWSFDAMQMNPGRSVNTTIFQDQANSCHEQCQSCVAIRSTSAADTKRAVVRLSRRVLSSMLVLHEDRAQAVYSCIERTKIDTSHQTSSRLLLSHTGCSHHTH